MTGDSSPSVVFSTEVVTSSTVAGPLTNLLLQGLRALVVDSGGTRNFPKHPIEGGGTVGFKVVLGLPKLFPESEGVTEHILEVGKVSIVPV